MLVRILNTLRSRIWDMVLFLFSDYIKLTVGENWYFCLRKTWGFSKSLWISLEWISPEEDTFLLDCIKIISDVRWHPPLSPTFWRIFSLVNSHNLLGNPLLFPTEIINLLFVIKTRQPLKQNFMLNCKKTMIKKKELL